MYNPAFETARTFFIDVGVILDSEEVINMGGYRHYALKKWFDGLRSGKTKFDVLFVSMRDQGLGSMNGVDGVIV